MIVFVYGTVRTQFGSLAQRINEPRPKKLNTMKVDSNDKKIKINWFNLKKIFLGTVRGDQFLYISHKLDYKFNS